MTTRISTPEQARQLIDQYDHFLFDCDGVIWLDSDVIPGALEFIHDLKVRGKTYAFVTNNSSRLRNNYVQKFAQMGFRDVTKGMIYPTSYLAALVLRDQLKVPLGSKIWVFGDEGIEEELAENGYVPVGGTDAALNVEWDPNLPLLDVDPAVKAVVAGLTKKVNYMRIATTVQYLLANDRALPYVGTNIDRTYPGPKGRILPAGGAMVQFFEYTCEREFVDVGKPSPAFLEAILQLQGFRRDKTLMVGDTLYTDVKFGNDGKLGGSNGGTLLVLSGGTTQADLDKAERAHADVLPAYYCGSLGELYALSAQANGTANGTAKQANGTAKQANGTANGTVKH